MGLFGSIGHQSATVAVQSRKFDRSNTVVYLLGPWNGSFGAMGEEALSLARHSATTRHETILDSEPLVSGC